MPEDTEKVGSSRMASTTDERSSLRQALKIGLILVLTLVVTWLLWSICSAVFSGDPPTAIGGLDALFSGLALLAVVYALTYQRKELEMQRREMGESRRVLAEQARIQRQTTRAISLSSLIECLSHEAGKATQSDEAVSRRTEAEQKVEKRITELTELLDDLDGPPHGEEADAE